MKGSLTALQLDAALAIRLQAAEEDKFKMIVKAIYETMGHKIDFNHKVEREEDFVSFENLMVHELAQDGTVIE